MKIPKKSLGQNFLKDKNIVNKIIKSINITNNKIVEIGPGLGILTKDIIKLNPKKLILIEKDKDLFQYLQKNLYYNKLEIICDDALYYNYKNIKNFQLISNLPYNISSKFLTKVIKLNKNFTNIICMIQSELAEKFDYNNGKMNKYKFLSKYCSEFKILFNVSSTVFYPKPKVKSKVVKFILKKKIINELKLNSFINTFFVNKRKKIKSNKIFYKIIDDDIINKRYEDLNYEQILNIYKRFDFFIS